MDEFGVLALHIKPISRPLLYAEKKSQLKTSAIFLLHAGGFLGCNRNIESWNVYSRRMVLFLKKKYHDICEYFIEASSIFTSVLKGRELPLCSHEFHLECLPPWMPLMESPSLVAIYDYWLAGMNVVNSNST